VTEKLDGENTSLYQSGSHARSIDSNNHPSRNWVKGWHGSIAHLLPDGWRLCGENVYAAHSVRYENLDSFFYLFSVWNAENTCLSWDDTKEWAEKLGCPTPREFYRGIWDRKLIEGIEVDTNVCEGYVVRLAESYSYDEFPHAIGKWVRMNHVTTDQHWMSAPIIPNKLKT